MKIVHEFSSRFGKPQSGGTGNPYGIKVTEPPPEKFPGFQADLMCALTDGHGHSEEALYFEGDGAAMKKTLKAMLLTLEMIEESARQRYEEHRQAVRHCERCLQWTLPDHRCLAQAPEGAPFSGEKVGFVYEPGNDYEATLTTVPTDAPHPCAGECKHLVWAVWWYNGMGSKTIIRIDDWSRVTRFPLKEKKTT